MALFNGAKNEEKLHSVKRKGYFSRVRKRWKHKDVVEINKDHPKYLFTQYIRVSLRQHLTSEQQNQNGIMLYESDFTEIREDTCLFKTNKTVIQFHSYAPSIFSYIRYMMGISRSDYLAVVAPVLESDFYLEFMSNSKSGQNFFLSKNKQVMIKTVTKREAKFLFKILDKYLDHFQKYPHSLLVKFLGLHSIKMKLLQKPVYFIVMLSIFYPNENIKLRYDIKACLIGRYTKPSTDKHDLAVYKELNWKDKKIALGSQRDWFLRQIKIDSDFLKGIGVLDYSLLVGIQPIDPAEKEMSQSFASVVTRATKSYGKNQSVRGLKTLSLDTFDREPTKTIFGGSCTNLAKTIVSDDLMPNFNVNEYPIDLAQDCSTKGTSFPALPGMTPKVHSTEDVKLPSLPGMIANEESSFVFRSTSESKLQDAPIQELQTEQSSNVSCSVTCSPVHFPKRTHPQNKTKNNLIVKLSNPDIFGRGGTGVISPEEAIKENRRLLPDCKNELHIIEGDEKYYIGIIDFFTRYTLKKRLENAYKRVIYPPLSFSTVHPDVFADRFYDFWVQHSG